MTTKLTKEAQEGYAAPAGALCPYLHSSPADMAWRLGQHARNMFLTPPVTCTMSRGYTLWLDGVLWREMSDGRWVRWDPNANKEVGH